MWCWVLKKLHFSNQSLWQKPYYLMTKPQLTYSLSRDPFLLNSRMVLTILVWFWFNSRMVLKSNYLCWRDGCKVIVFMMRGMKSTMSFCTCCLYIWYMSTTMIGSSARTFKLCTPIGIMVYWEDKKKERAWEWDFLPRSFKFHFEQ